MKWTVITSVVVFIIFALATTIDKAGRRIKTYAIQNAQTGKNLRPFEANKSDGNKLILYNHHSWKCMTWEFTQVGENTYQLKNRYTLKTFQPFQTPRPSVELWQQPISDDKLQHWEFVKQPDSTLMIRLAGTDLYITASSAQTNSVIIQQPKQQSALQLWRLVEQNPLF